MNWSKAKTILIIIFAVLNTILYIDLISMNKPAKPIISDAELSAVYKILSENKIKLETDIPREITPMPLLKVEKQNIKYDYILQKFIRGRQYVKYNDNKYTVYKFNNEVIKTGNGLFYYTNKDSKFSKMDKNMKEHYIIDFIADYKLSEPDSVFNETYNDDEVIIRYSEIYKGYFVDTGYMEAKINNEGFQFEKSWLKPVGMENSYKDIIPADSGLLKLIEIKDKNLTIIIKEIKLGYYFSWAEAQTGEAVPVWRITTESGKKYYINAYTGNIESR